MRRSSGALAVVLATACCAALAFFSSMARLDTSLISVCKKGGCRIFDASKNKAPRRFSRGKDSQKILSRGKDSQMSLVQLLAGEAVEPLHGKGPLLQRQKAQTQPRGWRRAEVRSAALGQTANWARELENDHREQAAEHRAVLRLKLEEQEEQRAVRHRLPSTSNFQRSVVKFMTAEGAHERQLKSKFAQKSAQKESIVAINDEQATEESEVHAGPANVNVHTKKTKQAHTEPVNSLMLQPQTAPPQDEAVEHGEEPEEESEAEAGTTVHDSAPDTPDQLEGAQHVGADEEEDDVFHYQHGKKADTESEPRIVIPVKGGEIEVPLDAVGFDRDSVDGEEADMQLPHTQEPEQHVMSWEEREAGLEAAEATAEAKTMDVEHFQETFPKVQHDQAEMEEEEEREHVAHAQDAEMDVEEKREHAAHAAQEEQENEEKALHEAEASFPAPGDTSEAVDESTEHKALQDAEVSFPEPLADDDEESRGKEEEAHSTYTRTAEGGVEKAHVDTANLVRLSLKVPMDAQSFTPELRETFVGAIAKAAGVDMHKVAMPFFGAFDGDSDAEEESEQHTSAEDQHPDAEEIDDDDQEAPHTDVAHNEKDLPDTADTQIADIPDMPHISHDHAVPDDDVLDKRRDLHVDRNETAVHEAAMALQQEYITLFEQSEAVGSHELASGVLHDSSRRLLSASIKVDLEIMATDPAAAAELAAALTINAINEQLTAAGLPRVEMLKAPYLTALPPSIAPPALDPPPAVAPVPVPHTRKPSSSDHVTQGGVEERVSAGGASDLPHHGPSLWPHHQAQVEDDSKARDPTKLEREGVNVDGAGGAYRALALPIFDETQWDHVLGGPKAASDGEERDARDTGLHVLKKAGVLVDGVPIEEDSNHDKGWLPKPGKPNKSFVHTLFGMQTRLPYFADASDAQDEDGSRQALVKAGVSVGPLTWDGQDHPISGASDQERQR